MQSKGHSALEAVCNVIVGYGVAVAATQAILPLFGYPVRFSDNLAISGFFTVISLVRSYALRRLFNWWDSYA